MNIPYKVTNEIRDTLGWPNQLYQAFWDILIQANGLGFLLGGLEIEKKMKKAIKEHQRRYPKRKHGRATVVASEKANPVFDHVLRRTLPFFKPMEFVAVRQIMKGLPQLAIPGCNLSESTIRRVMIWLSPLYSNPSVFVKLNYRPSVIQTRIYGLNIPFALRTLKEIWENCLVDHQIREDYLSNDNEFLGTNCRIADLGKLMLEPCIKYCDNFDNAFSFMVNFTNSKRKISDIYDFLEELKEHFPDIAGLDFEFMDEREKIMKKVKRRVKKREKVKY